MNKVAWRRAVISILILGLIVYLCIAFCRTDKEIPVIKGIDIEIKNKQTVNVADIGEIKGIIGKSGLVAAGKRPAKDAAQKLQTLLESKSYLKKVMVYHTGDGVMHVELVQRTPVARALADNGSWYFDSEGKLFPKTVNIDLPVISASMSAQNLMKNEVFAHKLTELVATIAANPFWNAQIQQIDIDSKRNIRFAVSSADHIVRFGQIDGFKEKLANLEAFYKTVKREKNIYSILDLRFNKQIVAIKK
jgi:cell division protein FtsQ